MFVRGLVFLFLVFPLLAFGIDPEVDVDGSADFPLLTRYPHSTIVRYASGGTIEPYTLILGTLKEINNVLSPDASRQIEGLMTRITYRIPDGKRSSEVFEYFRKQLDDKRAEILFLCHGLDCGGSNNWANRVFRIAMLYGPEQFQHYLAARFLLEGREHFIALYTLQRGNRRLYAHMEIIAAPVDHALDAQEEIVETLTASGRYPLVGVDFDAAGMLTGEALQVLRRVAGALKGQPALHLFVVGHLDRPVSLEENVRQSKARAEQVMRYLVEQGMDAGRLTAAGVGPLAPTAGFSRDRIELVSHN